VHHYHHHHHHVHHHVVPCEPAKVKHVTHLKHLKHMKTYHAHHIMPPPPPYIENVYIIQQSAPPPLPTTVVIPLSTTPPPQAVVQPQAVGQPCATGDCEIPCESTSQIDIKGPCADPNQPCVERVSFNNDGDATGITLEPRTSPNSQAHFELSTPPATDAPSWSKVAQATTTTNTDSSDDSTHVSLVVPFMKSAYASLASAGPVPA
jgi:hypothetical protein